MKSFRLVPRTGGYFSSTRTLCACPRAHSNARRAIFLNAFVSWPCVSTPKLKQNTFFGDCGSFVSVLRSAPAPSTEPFSMRAERRALRQRRPRHRLPVAVICAPRGVIQRDVVVVRSRPSAFVSPDRFASAPATPNSALDAAERRTRRSRSSSRCRRPSRSGCTCPCPATSRRSTPPMSLMTYVAGRISVVKNVVEIAPVEVQRLPAGQRLAFRRPEAVLVVVDEEVALLRLPDAELRGQRADADRRPRREVRRPRTCRRARR